MAASLKTLHTDFLEDLEIGQGRSQKTVSNYDHYLQRFYTAQQIAGVTDITLDTVRNFRRALNDGPAGTKGGGMSLATQNYHLIALRQFLKYLARRDIEALSAEKIGLAKLAEREIDVLYPEEVDALLLAPAANTLEGARDSAILQTLFSTGLRISEAVKLDRDDIRKNKQEVAVRGKGNKVRVVFLSPDAHSAIGNYLSQRQDIDPALFVRHNPASKKPQAETGRRGAEDLRLTPRSIQRMIKKHAAKAGLTKDITPHTLRHSFATDLLSNGADVREVQQLLGHASITTTQIYTHLTDVHLQDVHAKYHHKKPVED